MNSYTPEKLNLWDRFFNRYRKEVREKGTEHWTRHDGYTNEMKIRYVRRYVEYNVIDRLTGSVTVTKEYLE